MKLRLDLNRGRSCSAKVRKVDVEEFRCGARRSAEAKAVIGGGLISGTITIYNNL